MIEHSQRVTPWAKGVGFARFIQNPTPEGMFCAPVRNIPAAQSQIAVGLGWPRGC